MGMNRDFQITILKEAAKCYPYHALDVWDDLLNASPGNSADEKQSALIAHLTALEEFDYIKEFVHGSSHNRAFRITAQGLLAAGEDVLHPDPYASLREAIYAQAQVLRSLSQEDAKTLKGVLASLPRVALERLRDKGLDQLLGLIFGLTG